MIERVQTAADPRLHLYTGARDPELLREHSLFVAESRTVIERALASSYVCRGVLLTEAGLSALAPLVEPLSCPVLVVERPLMQELAGYRVHQGALALFERPPERTLATLLAAARRHLVVLVQVSDPDNVGSIFRSAAALGACGVVLAPGSADPLYRKAIRTSMGATLTLPWAHALATWPDELRRGGWSVVALTPLPEAMDITVWSPRGPQALLFGNEGDGLPAGLLAAADARVRIPVQGDSLNVSAAAAVALHCLRERAVVETAASRP
jgi:tRNA G18 (ribose-2'-O)-methylase SpoU